MAIAFLKIFTVILLGLTIIVAFIFMKMVESSSFVKSNKNNNVENMDGTCPACPTVDTTSTEENY